MKLRAIPPPGFAVIGAFLGDALLWAWLVSKTEVLSGDQIGIGTFLLKRTRPEALARDFLLSDPAASAFYTPAFVALLGRLVTYAGTLTDALRLLSPLLVFVYLCGFYVLLRRLGIHRWPASLVALGSLTIRLSMGDSFWGLGPLDMVLPRSLFLALLPIVLLAHFSANSRLSCYGTFLTLGLLTYLHPVSGPAVACGLALARLLDTREPMVQKWRGLLGAAVIYALAVSPFAYAFLTRPVRVTPGTESSAIASDLFLNYLGFNFPSVWNCVMFFADSWTLWMAAIIAVAWRAARGGVGPIDRFCLGWSIGIAAYSIGGSTIILYWARLTRTVPLSIDQLRNTHFLYLGLLIYFAFLLQDVMARCSRPWAPLVALGGLAVLLSAPNLSFDYRSPATWFRWSPLSWRTERYPEPFQDLCRWARQGTAPDDLFVFEEPAFRLFSERSVTGTPRDYGILYYSDRTRIRDWAEYMGRLKSAARDRSALERVDAGRVRKAEYVVVPAGWQRLRIGVAYENTEFVVYDIHPGPAADQP